MFSRILVPTDFGGPSEAAIEYARMLARTFGGSLQLLHVLDNVFLRPVVGDPHALEDAVLKRLHDRFTDEDRKALHATAAVERSDEPADEIVSYVRTTETDLLVMGTHGRTGVAHLLLGSVAEKVVRTAPCPVLTARERPPAAFAGFTRILVPTDFSAPSDAALDCAKLIALRFGASVHLLHVLEDALVEGPFGSEVFLAESPDARAARFKDARERLSHRVTAYDRERMHATSEVIFGATARTIGDYAADNDFDLIVMGTHGRTGIAHLLMGSVAERVVRNAACPVITTHSPLACAGVRVAAGGHVALTA